MFIAFGCGFGDALSPDKKIDATQIHGRSAPLNFEVVWCTRPNFGYLFAASVYFQHHRLGFVRTLEI